MYPRRYLRPELQTRIAVENSPKLFESCMEQNIPKSGQYCIDVGISPIFHLLGVGVIFKIPTVILR